MINPTEKTKTFYNKLHVIHDDGIDLDNSIPIHSWWDLDVEFFIDKVILEAGCGGIGTQAIQLYSYRPSELLVIDLSSDNIATASKNIFQVFPEPNNMTLKTLDLGSELLPKEKFDIIHHRGVFQHIEKKDFAIHNFFQSLKPGGYLIVAAYGKGGLFAYSLLILRKIFHWIPEKLMFRLLKLIVSSTDLVSGIIDHLYVPIETRYTHKEFEEFFCKRGFKIYKDLNDRKFDFTKIKINFKNKLFKLWTIKLNPLSLQRWKFITYLLFGQYGNYYIFKKE